MSVSAQGERNLIGWGAQLWPAQRESFFARAASRLPLAVNSSDVMDRDLAAYLEPLADPHTVLGPMACLVLALGLAAQDNALRGHAQEGLIASIQERRLPVEAAGATMARLLDTGFNKLTRWAKALGEVARVTPDHARCTAELLQHVLHADPTKAPRDVSALLELLLELLCELHEPLRDLEARRFLSGLTTGGKTAKIVRQLLATSA